MQPVAVVLAFFSIVALLIALGRLLSGHRAAALGNFLLGLLLGFVALATMRFAQELCTFDDHVASVPVAEIVFEKTSARHYRATLTRLPSGRMKVFVIAGDEWRVDGRLLGWQPVLQPLGLKSRYRLEGLSTRFLGTAPTPPETTEPYPLTRSGGRANWNGRPWDALVSVGPRLSSPWRPLTDHARYQLSFERTGIQAEPANEAAEKSMRDRP